MELTKPAALRALVDASIELARDLGNLDAEFALVEARRSIGRHSVGDAPKPTVEVDGIPFSAAHPVKTRA